MDKINFENLPSTNTPISADNLNLMQNNIETEINSINGSDIRYEIFDGNSEIKVFQLFEMEIGGIYSVAISYNFNPAGSPEYRSIIYGILSLPVGYVDNKVVISPKFDVISNYFEMTFVKDGNVAVVCERGETLIDVSEYKQLPHLYLYITNGSGISGFNVKIKKLN